MIEIDVHDSEVPIGRSWDPSSNFDQLLDGGNVINIYSDAIDQGLIVEGTVDTDTPGAYEIAYSYEGVEETVQVIVVGIEISEDEANESVEISTSGVTPVEIGTATDETNGEKLDRIEGKIDMILSILQPNTEE